MDDETPATRPHPDHDRGLDLDLQTLGRQRRHRDRRAVLGLIGAGAVGGAGLLAGCGSGAADAATTSATTTDTTTGTTTDGTASAETATETETETATSTAATCTTEEIPSETAGPYPGDGSNGPDALTESGIVRRDIRSSFGSAGTTAATGVDLRFALVLQSTTTCQPVSGLAVYAWHCDRLGRYSMYDAAIADENYLRGVQVSNAKGVVRFRSIYPACYSGRWPHIHVEVYARKQEATGGGTPIVTSQIALPRRQSLAVYRSSHGYTGSEANLSRVSLSSDMVFADDRGVRQLPAMKGSVSTGFKAGLVVPVDA